MDGNSRKDLGSWWTISPIKEEEEEEEEKGGGEGEEEEEISISSVLDRPDPCKLLI
jgi:hypothetical protein